MATDTPDAIRPTKKQRELLSFIEHFITEHGYSPSYREIMNGLNYTSVATVSLHVTSLIRRGHLRKRDRSARSLEVVAAEGKLAATISDAPGAEAQWLIGRIDEVFKQVQAAGEATPDSLDDLQALIRALQLLGMPAAAQDFTQRIPSMQDTGTDNG